MLKVGDLCKVTKGCKVKGIKKGEFLVVEEIKEVGKEFSFFANIVFKSSSSFKRIKFNLRYKKYLENKIINMNDGNPMNKIQVERICYENSSF